MHHRALRPGEAVEPHPMRDADASSPRRPRAVPDAPIAPFTQGIGLAKAWMLELLAGLPLADAGRLPAAVMAQEAPTLCAAVCAAVASDDALDRLGPDGAQALLASRAGAMAGATEPGAITATVDALRRVTWTALMDELRAPDARLVADLAERLAHVTAVLTAAALEARTAPSVDVADDPLPGVVSLLDARGARDEPAAWRAALERRLERYARDDRPFALLLVELDDLRVLLSAYEADEFATAIQALERAIGATLRAGDVLVREDPGRYWIMLGEADDEASRDLATDIAAGVRGSVALHGTGLTVSVGVASCPGDGTALEPLTERADEGVFLARAAGLPVTS